jgi:ssDNA-binding Zn-finger/Zn-ribbon topoisomerase 1
MSREEKENEMEEEQRERERTEDREREKELVALGVCTSVLQARKVIAAGKYEKYREIGARNRVEYTNLEALRLKGSTAFPCPKCKKGFLTQRTNRLSKETFWGCTTYPLCDYTQKEEK